MDANVIVERPGQHSAPTFDVNAGAPRQGVGISIERPSGGGGGRPPVAAARPTAPQPPPRAAAPPKFDEEDLETFAEYANPSKMRPPNAQYPPAAAGGSDYDDEDDEDDGDNEDGSDGDPGAAGGSPSEYGDDDGMGGGGVGLEPEPEHVLRPSEGYRTLDEEKADILFKLSRLRKQGFRGFRDFTTYSDIRDMRTELARVKTELEVERSIRFSRTMLLNIVGMLEYANNRWDPFDLHLDGWSETMHEGIDDYDGVFEELYFKYRGKLATPPEVRLIMMIGGSAFAFHLQHALVQKMMPNLGDAMRQNPEVMNAMMNAMKPQQPLQQQAPQQPPPQQPPPQSGQQRAEMQGPGLDMSRLMGGGLGGLGGLGGMGLGGGGAMTGALGMPPTMTRPPASVPVNDIPRPAPSRVRDVARPPVRDNTAGAAARGSAREVPAAMDEDRFSDVISEDLQSVPDDLASVSSDGGGGDGGGGSGATRNITIAAAGRKRGAGPAAARPPAKQQRRPTAAKGAAARKVIEI